MIHKVSTISESLSNTTNNLFLTHSPLFTHNHNHSLFQPNQNFFKPSTAIVTVTNPLFIFVFVIISLSYLLPSTIAVNHLVCNECMGVCVCVLLVNILINQSLSSLSGKSICILSLIAVYFCLFNKMASHTSGFNNPESACKVNC